MKREVPRTAAMLLVSGLILVFAGPARASLIDGLHAYYAFENDSADPGGVLDTSGNNRHGTGPVGSGLATVTGKVGNALSFNGASGSEVVINQVPESDFDFINSDFTIQAWFQVNSFTTQWQALVAKGEGGGWRLHRYNATSNLAVNLGQGDTQTGNMNDGAWHHVVAIHDAGSTTDIWIDGGLAVSGSGSGPGDRSGIPTIGDNPEANNRNWNGLIDELAFWNRTLTTDEVAQLYNNGSGMAIPEPATMGLLALSGLALLRRRRS